MKKYNLFLILTLVSCSPTIRNFDKYQKAPLLETKFMPSKEAVMGKPAVIAVFPLETNDMPVAEKINLGSSMAVDIENILTKDKIVELADRKAFQKLRQEVELSEMKSDKIYEGPIVADYIISGSISRTNFTSKYISGRHNFNANTGSYSYIPPKWRYNAEVSGNIKIYELPSLRVVENFEIRGKSQMTENAGSKTKVKTEDESLIKKTSKEALDYISADLKNFFSQKGYILEKKVLGRRTIFKTSLGSRSGAKPGDKIIILAKKEEENELAARNEIIEQTIAEGSISDIINQAFSWIIITNEKDIAKIRLGDIVQIKYKKSFWQKHGGVIKGAGTIAADALEDVSSSSRVTF
jgi:hypothetical protein